MTEGKEMLLEYLISLIESRDFFAEHHCEKVRRFTEIMLDKVVRFCPEYQLTEKDCDQIAFAATMHDLGKIIVPDHILHKPGKLDYEEQEIMKNHTRKGRQIFEHITGSMKPEDPEYYEAKRLLKFLEYFLGVSSEELPKNSIVREFVGGSCFNV